MNKQLTDAISAIFKIEWNIKLSHSEIQIIFNNMEDSIAYSFFNDSFRKETLTDYSNILDYIYVSSLDNLKRLAWSAVMGVRNEDLKLMNLDKDFMIRDFSNRLEHIKTEKDCYNYIKVVEKKEPNSVLPVITHIKGESPIVALVYYNKEDEDQVLNILNKKR